MAYGAISQNGTQRVAAAPRKRRLVALAAGALALAVLGVATVRPGGVGRAVGSFAETAPGAGLASASQDGSSTSGEAEKEADCGLKDLAYFTMIGNGEATFTRAGVQGDFTFYNFSIGPSNLAPVVAVRVEDGDRDMYSTMKTPVFLKDWRYGFLKDGMDFNPDSFVVPEDKLVNDDNMSAAITIRFSEDDDSTTLFAAQFVALDKPKSDTDLYTMVVRVSACAKVNHRGAAIYGLGRTVAVAAFVAAVPAHVVDAARFRQHRSTRTTTRRKRSSSRRAARTTPATTPRSPTSTCSRTTGWARASARATRSSSSARPSSWRSTSASLLLV
mmetsp:Transcript_23916/g.72007  ORF Transcript_23916/g.72007 Transcript_23916/m.72007 type:complete len:330 (-) Transcript_23916:745-1734(-)